MEKTTTTISIPRMSYKSKHSWILVLSISYILRPVKVQFQMPMQCPPMFPAPPPIFPMPMPVMASALCPVPIPGDMLPSKTSTTTTTTTRPETIGIAIPVPVPMPIPMPMGVPILQQPNLCQTPPPRPNNCPPCPPCVCSPSCTPPAFSYCSPCHLKCRCRSKEDVPKPLPYHPARPGPAYGMAVPMPVMPPPVIMVPYPPPIPLIPRPRPRKEEKSRYAPCSDESTESSSSESDYKRRRRHKKGKHLGFRRSLRSSDSDDELVKPMLSYVADNGDVKFKTKISSDDVAELLGEHSDAKDSYHKVQVLTDDDKNSRRNVVVVRNNNGKQKRERYKNILLRGRLSNHVLDDGKKELVFRPSGDKKISNLTVSFQIS